MLFCIFHCESFSQSLPSPFFPGHRLTWLTAHIHSLFVLLWNRTTELAQLGFRVPCVKLKRIFSPLLYQPEPRRTLHTRFDTARLETLLVKSTDPSIEYFLSMLVRSGHPLLCLHFCVTRGASPVQRTFIIESKASIHEKSLYTIFMTQNVVLST